jgi:hypothetical protein
VWRVIQVVLRAAVWRRTSEPHLVGLLSLLGWAGLLVAVRLATQFAETRGHGGFNPYGLNAAIAWVALEIAIAALFINPVARATALSAMLALTILAEVAVNAIKFASTYLPLPGFAGSQVVSAALFAVVSLWWIGAMVAVLRSFTRQPLAAMLVRAAALWLALVAVSAVVPHVPVFVSSDFDVRTANLWEAALARLAVSQSTDSAQARDASGMEQPPSPSLLQKEVSALTPRTTGDTNVYALGISGWAGEDVFLKELDGGLAALSAVLPINGHVIRLANAGETLQTLPPATPGSIDAAVKAISKIINRDEDILLVLMTSHGMRTGFGLRFPNGAVTELTPAALTASLENAGIKNRVVIVSACFAGIFLPPLANDHSVVLTAADATHTSFGCAPERDWTYFGDAFFRQSVRPGSDFQQAFDSARVLIAGWELMDRAQPSNPQAHFGSAIVAKLAPLFQTTQASGH